MVWVTRRITKAASSGSKGEQLSRNSFLYNLVESLYSRTDGLPPGHFPRTRGHGGHQPPYVDYATG